MLNFRNQTEIWFRALQAEITLDLERLDGTGRFSSEPWTREEGGGGHSMSMTHGTIIEKGGVNFSAVLGPLPRAMENGFGSAGTQFFATGISIVLHPVNPWMPIIHMNTRYFEMEGGSAWFGGGIDLTPHYIDAQDALFFHSYLKTVCDLHDETYYPRFKPWADTYFYIPHRGETRGIGGIFFDRLAPTEHHSLLSLFAFTQAIGKSFMPIYSHFLEKYRGRRYTDRDRAWQAHRRSRYVEFNLVYDAGTKFGLETKGRTESILMSMPPMATWTPEADFRLSPEEQFTRDHLKMDIDWLHG